MRADATWARHCADEQAERVKARTGIDVWAVLGGQSPRSSRDYAALLRAHGQRSLSGLVSIVMGPAVPRGRARRGDVVRKGWALGECVGDHARFYGGSMVPMREIDEGWRLDAP